MSGGLWALVAVFVAAVAYMMLRRQDDSAKGNTKPAKKQQVLKRVKAAKRAAAEPANPYRSTSIKPGASACAAVSELTGKRFLVDGDKIPPIPLMDCDNANCSCKYVKHRDRRSTFGERRSLGDSHLAMLSQNIDSERRDKKSGRREIDEDYGF